MRGDTITDVFRFMVLRPPEAIDPDASSYVSTENAQSTFQFQLKRLRRAETTTLKNMVQSADEFIASERYVLNVNQLNTPLRRFGEHLRREKSPSVEKLNEIIQEVFGQDGVSLVDSEEYSEDRRNVADSLIALAITDEGENRNYEDLAHVMRLCGLLERVAAKDATLETEGAIGDALNRAVLLPKEIFPLPPQWLQVGISSEEQEEIRRKKEKEKEKAEKLAQQLSNLQTALDELKTMRSSDFKKMEYLLEKKEDGTVKLASDLPEQTPWILSEEATNRLSESARTGIDSAGISLDTTPLPEITTILENKLIEVGSRVFEAKKLTRINRIGSTFFKVPIERPLPEIFDIPVCGSFRAIGVADLEIVRQELQKYEAGEVAHIENVLQGESKERTHRRTRRTEETYLMETETIEESEKDLQSTERFEVQRETQEMEKRESSFDVGVTVKYGCCVDVTASTKYSLKNAKEKSTQTATNFARESTERSVSRIQERVREQRIRKTIEEFEEKNVHSVDNAKGNDHVVGIYRWVDKVYKAQVYNYGKRLMFEFIIPEPAAFASIAPELSPTENTTLKEPEEPSNPDGDELLKPEHLKPENYQKLIAQYQVIDVEPPPPPQIMKAYTWQSWKKPETGNTLVFEGKSDKIPIDDGYAATKAHCWVEVLATKGAPPNHVYFEEKTVVDIVIGTERFSQIDPRYFSGFSKDLRKVPGEVPIFIQATHNTKISVSVEILCDRTEDALKKWKQKTYGAIMQAYLNLKSQYEEQMAAAAVEEGIRISGRNPKLNRELEQLELKKGALTLLTRKTSPHFKGIGSIIEGYKGYPEIDFEEADREAPYIQFFEQAFEWTQIMYTFYPYFWARKEKWPKLQQIDDNDPLYARFLRAGAARVLVPVRPGYEESLLYYLESNKIWKGRGPPDVKSELYLPLHQDIKEKQGAGFEGKKVGDPWEVKVPTSLVFLQKGSELPNFVAKKKGRKCLFSWE